MPPEWVQHRDPRPVSKGKSAHSIQDATKGLGAPAERTQSGLIGRLLGIAEGGDPPPPQWHTSAGRP